MCEQSFRGYLPCDRWESLCSIWQTGGIPLRNITLLTLSITTPNFCTPEALPGNRVRTISDLVLSKKAHRATEGNPINYPSLHVLFTLKSFSRISYAMVSVTYSRSHFFFHLRGQKCGMSISTPALHLQKVRFIHNSTSATATCKSNACRTSCAYAREQKE